MLYSSSSGQRRRVHEHPSDQDCQWVSVFIPLAFLVFQTPVLIQSLSQSSYANGKALGVLSMAEYSKWVCKEDDKGIPNLLNVLLHVCELRGMPSSPL